MHRSLGGYRVQELVPMDLGCITILVCESLHPPGSSQKPIARSFIGMMDHCLHFQFLPTLWRNWEWGWGWKFQASNHSLVFLWEAPTREPIREESLSKETYLIRAKCAPSDGMTGVYKNYRSSEPELGAEIKIHVYCYLTLIVSFLDHLHQLFSY